MRSLCGHYGCKYTSVVVRSRLIASYAAHCTHPCHFEHMVIKAMVIFCLAIMRGPIPWCNKAYVTLASSLWQHKAINKQRYLWMFFFKGNVMLYLWPLALKVCDSSNLRPRSNGRFLTEHILYTFSSTKMSIFWLTFHCTVLWFLICNKNWLVDSQLAINQ